MRPLIAAFLLVAVFIIGSALLFTRQQGGPSFDDSTQQLLANLLTGYTLPATIAAAKADQPCRDNMPKDDQTCIDFIQTLRQDDPVLTNAIDQLRSLRSNAPVDASQDLVRSMDDFFTTYSRAHASNQILLRAWDSNDLVGWR